MPRVDVISFGLVHNFPKDINLKAKAIGLVYLFNGISTLMGYLILKPSL